MASRYAVATGNWNSTSTWSATSGGAGGAGVPTSGDNVYINANFTITLTADATCYFIIHTNGALVTSSYNLTMVAGIRSSGSTARTITFGSGTITASQSPPFVAGGMSFTGSNLTFNCGTSLLLIKASGSPSSDFDTMSKTFNDVRIEMGPSASNISQSLNITGSPTFRLLDIRSANSAAHTVNFNSDFAEIKAEKFVAIGTSSSNRLKFTATSSDPEVPSEIFIVFPDTGSCYGQFVDIQNTIAGVQSDWSPTPYNLYIGANSVGSSGNWVLQDPPKISTLVDPLTTAPGSNSNWVFSDPVSTGQGSFGIGGGGYIISGDAASFDTFDIIDSSVTVEGHVSVSSVILAINSIPASGLYAFIGTSSDNSSNGAYQFQPYRDTLANSNTGIISFGRISLSSSTRILKIEGSLDGVAWSTYFSSSPIPADQIPYYRSLRIALLGSPGSVNMLPAPQASGNFFAFF